MWNFIDKGPARAGRSLSSPSSWSPSWSPQQCLTTCRNPHLAWKRGFNLFQGAVAIVAALKIVWNIPADR